MALCKQVCWKQDNHPHSKSNAQKVQHVQFLLDNGNIKAINKHIRVHKHFRLDKVITTIADQQATTHAPYHQFITYNRLKEYYSNDATIFYN